MHWKLSKVLPPAIVILVLLAAAPVLAALFPLEPGEAVVTSSPFGIVPGQPGSRDVLTIIDVRAPLCDPRAVLGENWTAPRYSNAMPNPTGNPADAWTDANLGQVFGIALDDALPPSIYLTSTAVYLQTAGTGRVFRIDGASGAIAVFADLPNTGAGLGNLAFDRDHGQFYVTDFEDGILYSLDRTGGIREEYDPFVRDDGLPGFCPLGERLWGVGVHAARVYFAVWAEDLERPDPLRANTIWSIGLDAAGLLVRSDLTLELSLPPLDGSMYSNPVADIEFSPDGRMLLAERTMRSDDEPDAHASRLLEYGGGHLAWTPAGATFYIGEVPPGASSAGGADYDCDPGGPCDAGPRTWVTGDALHLRPQTLDFLYGIQGLPQAGGGIADSYLVDLDGLSSIGTKTSLGDVDLYRRCPAACTPPVVAAAPVARLCAGDPVTLDGSPTTGCPPGRLEYRWMEGTTVVCGWSSLPACGVSPPASTTYRLEARCLGEAGCTAFAIVGVTVDPPPLPALAAPPLTCAGSELTLDASASQASGCGVPLEYRFRSGATILQPWSPASAHGPFVPPGSAVYAVDVRCGACERSAEQSVAVVSPPSAVAAAGAAGCPGERVLLDGAGSAGCPPGELELRWLDGATEACPWSTSLTCAVAPTASTSYTLETRCASLPTCTGGASVTVTPGPVPQAALRPLGTVCAGATIDLDASGAAPNGCPGPLEYRFREGASVLRDWGPVASHGPVLPAGTATYSVDVRCAGCASSASTAVEVVPLPLAAAGLDASACLDAPVVLDASSSQASGCPGGPVFEWWEGTTLVRAASPDPTFVPPTSASGTAVYTVRVRCAGLPGCEGADDVELLVRACTLAVRFASFEARRLPETSAVEVRFRTVLEEGTNVFRVERAGTAAGPFNEVGDPLDARGGGSEYVLVDRGAGAAALPWYRIVEYTDGGRGESTASFRATAAGAQDSRGSSDARRRRGRRAPASR